MKKTILKLIIGVGLMVCTLLQADPSRFIESKGYDNRIMVEDTKTQLMWTKEIAEKTWEAAIKYCKGLNYGGYTDWRLPQLEDLKELIDVDSENPSSDFPGMSSLAFWSSTTYENHNGYAWYVYFNYGSGGYSYGSKGFNDSVRCVRDAS